MTEAQKILLEQLSAALFGKPTETAVTQEVIVEAMQQAVVTLLPLEGYREYWDMVRHNVGVTVAHQHLHDVMTKHGVPYSVLKGVASASYYPEPDRRQMGDVDFIVRPEDLQSARAALEAEGYQGWEELQEHHVCYDTAHGRWELHWKPPGVPDGNALEKTLADIVDCAVEYDGCMVPSRFHHGLVLLAHSAVHWINTGIGLRHLCDWAVFYAGFSEEEFLAMFEAPLKEAGLWKYTCIITAVCAAYLGSPAMRWAEHVSADYIARVMEDIQGSGNFGCKDDDRLNQAKLMTDEADMTVAGGGMLRQLMKALSAKAQILWPACRKHRILLPAGVIWVAGRHVGMVLQGRRPQIRVRSMVDGAKKRRELYQLFALFRPEE